MTKPTLLVLDDESDNLDALERIFRKTYRFIRASSGPEALKILALEPRIDVIITDQRMPSMTGVEFLEKTLLSHPKTVRILLTGYTDIDSIVAAVNQGHIFRYITKPWETTDLINSVEQAMQYYARGEEIELKNQALEKALDELKKLDQAKNNFMILINHELKTPLTVIQSFLSLLQESKPTSDQQKYLDRIQKSTSRLNDVIEDTLIITRYTAGVFKLNLQNLEPTDWFKSIKLEIENNFNSELLKKNQKLTFLDHLHLKSKELESAEHKPSPLDSNHFEIKNKLILLDSILIKKALFHLIENAIKFSHSQSNITVTLHWAFDSKKDQSNHSIQIDVINEGPPFSLALINEIKTPFKIQSEIMNHSKGLGIGLSVVNAIVKAHGGKLKIESTPLSHQESTHQIKMGLIFGS